MVRSLMLPLRELRKKVRMTQEQLASAAGVSLRSVQDIESGKTSPTISTLHALSGVLGVPMSAFFPEDPIVRKPLDITGTRLADRVLVLELFFEKVPAPIRNFILTNEVNWLNAAPALGIDPDSFDELRLILKKTERL